MTSHGVCLAGGALSVQAQAQEYGITPDDKVEANRKTLQFFSLPIARAASALATRGKRNPNMSNANNPDTV